MKWFTPRNVIIVAVAVVVITGLFVRPDGFAPPTLWTFVRGDIWLTERCFQPLPGMQYSRQYPSPLCGLELSYAWILAAAVVAIAASLMIRERK